MSRNRFRLIVFDVDGTLTPVRSVWQHIHEQLGTWEPWGVLHRHRFLEGSIDYATWCLLDAGAWSGFAEVEIRRIVERIPFHSGAEEALGALHRTGLIIATLSTGLTMMTDRVPYATLGMANRLLFRDGRATGEVQVEVAAGQKGPALQRLGQQLGVSPAETVAVGDSHGDCPMFQACGLGIAVDPADEEVARAATVVLTADQLSRLPSIVAQGDR